MQKIPYFSGQTKLNHFNSTMSALCREGVFLLAAWRRSRHPGRLWRHGRYRRPGGPFGLFFASAQGTHRFPALFVLIRPYLELRPGALGRALSVTRYALFKKVTDS